MQDLSSQMNANENGICYNLNMKIVSYILRGILPVLLCFALPIHLLAQQPEYQNRGGVNSIVLTFDPPVCAGINRSKDLFDAIVATMNANEPGLASEVDQGGAVWSASQNLSGVQFSLFYPDKPQVAIEIGKKFIQKLPAFFNFSSTPAEKIEFINYLHLLCELGNFKNSGHQPVSVYFNGPISEFADELDSQVVQLHQLYDQPRPAFSLEKPVLAFTEPTIFEVMQWDRIDAETFFSAKYLGEQFNKELSINGSGSYEIIFSNSALRLVLYASGSEADLFKMRAQIKQFTLQVLTRPNKQLWQNFARAAQALLSDDLRDLGKASMFDAWLHHWQGATMIKTGELNFIMPIKQCSNISMPEVWMHNFSYSNDAYPAFSASSDSDNKEIADIAVSIYASDTAIIDEIAECLNNRGGISFPFSAAKHGEKDILISFHSPLDEISGNLARIRARILNSLVEQGLLSDLPGSLKIGIAGVCAIPPFVLRGLLMDGWPSLTGNKKWSAAELKDIGEALNFADSDRDSLFRRWHLITATAKGKAEMLALLSSKNLKISSFSDF